MDGLLTPVSTTKRRRTESPLFQEVSSTLTERQAQNLTTKERLLPKSAEEALEILRHEPDYNSLVDVLQLLRQGPFNVAKPSPTAAQIVHVLVTDIAPNYWILLQEDITAKRKANSAFHAFLDCVRSIQGINAILLRLQALSKEAKSEKKDVKRPDLVSNLKITLALLEACLAGTDSIREIWASASADIENPSKRRPLAQEFVTLLGGGRVISWAVEAHEVARQAPDQNVADVSSWILKGVEYSGWLARNIATWVPRNASPDDAKLCSDLLARSLRLGYTDAVVKILVQQLLLGENAKPEGFRLLFDGLPNLDQRKVLLSVLNFLSGTYLNRLGRCDSPASGAIVGSAAAVIAAIVGNSDSKITHLTSWLTSSSGAGLGDGVGIRRAVIAVVAQSRDRIVGVLEKSISQFGDQLYIKHSPMLQQEAHAQVLLLSAGYVHRLAPMKLTILTRSSDWLNAISNRLGASQERARFLGLLVGEAISSLVKKGDTGLDFHMEETNLEEGKWYKGLVSVGDQLGKVEALEIREVHRTTVPEVHRPASSPKTASRPTRNPPKGFVIEELDDDESEEDDILPYAKPESDAEDSDEDPTLVRRDKAKAPVYIRDLIRYLRDTEDYDHQKLALTTAPTLIRRKGNFGTEVKEHADELASLLVGLQDQFEIDNFHQLRLQGMIALVVAQPELMGQWFAKTFYDGDYSVSQRAAILAVLGISARELAGFETSEYTEASSFPSKALPERVERLFIGSHSLQNTSSSSLKPLPPNALDNMAQSLTKSLLAPIAAEAADAVTGPDILKLSTFTSRLEQSAEPSKPQRRITTKRPRVRAIPNTTAQLLYTSFFSPLVARFQAALRFSSRTRGALIFQQPHLLATYLRTLGIVAHAAGPGTLALPAMTSELWGVLLRARSAGGGDMGIVRAVLFSLLALLDVNEGRMRDVCAEMGSEVVETMEWVSAVFEGTRGDDGGKGEENEVRMLAAAVLIRLREGVEKYRTLLVGDMIGL